MLANAEAWDTVEKAIKLRKHLVLPEYQNELACRVWAKHVDPIMERFYDKNCDFVDRLFRLPKLATITRKVRDEEFDKDNSELALIIKQILEEYKYTKPPSAGHAEEWLYQNELVIRTWIKSWEHFDKIGKTFSVDGKIYNWNKADYPNPFKAAVERDPKMHHKMKHDMIKVMTIERDRRHIQDTGIYTKEIVMQSLGNSTLFQDGTI